MVSLNELIQRYQVEVSQNPGQTIDQDQSPALTTVQYYQCQRNINLYDSPQLKNLATQSAPDRQLRILPFSSDLTDVSPDVSPGSSYRTSSSHSPNRPNPQSPAPFSAGAIPVCLYEDDYPGWIALDDVEALQPIERPYPVPVWTAAEIGDRIPQIIAYMKAAMAQPNEYLWGGVIGPNYDCSGLMQAAFRSQGIWLPRDAYQQEGFIQPVDLNALEMGDLIFFGPKERANHVALYLGDSFQGMGDSLPNRNAQGHYIHSSGKSMGRNGIGIDGLPHNLSLDRSHYQLSTLAQNSPHEQIDTLKELDDPISQAYAKIVHGAGRVVASYAPKGIPIKPIEAKVIPMT